MAELSGVPDPQAHEVVGTWDAVDPPNASLTFEPDDDSHDGTTGTVRGGDGCNGIGGSYQIEADGRAHITRGFGTLKYCMGVDDWLRKVISVSVDGDLMHVFNGDGHEIGQLHRRTGDSPSAPL